MRSRILARISFCLVRRCYRQGTFTIQPGERSMSIAVEKRVGIMPARQCHDRPVELASQDNSHGLNSRMLTIVMLVVVLGLFLRGWQFFLPRSLWMDEAFLALNIVDRDFAGLARPLDYEQGAPVGFLCGTKAATVLFGQNARAVRLMSWLMGMFALGLFFPVARKFVADSTALIALGLFALLPPMVYYSAELKPYSSDVAMSLLVLLLAARVQHQPARGQNWLMLGIGGAVALWLSFPIVFVLAGVGLVLGFQPLVYGAWRDRRLVLMMGLVWLASFGVHYQLGMKHLAAHGGLREWWHDYYRAYMPLPPNQVEDFKWFLDKGLGVFVDPVGLSTAGVALVCCLAGIQSLATRSRKQLALLVTPILVVLAASALRKYPFANRMIMFLTPMFLILVAEGVRQIREAGRALSLVGMTILILLFVHPTFAMVDQIKRGEPYSNPIIPATLEEIEPLMAHLGRHWQPGDEILVFRESQFAYRFYMRQYGLAERRFQVLNSHEPWNEQQQAQFAQLRGRPRVWIVFSRVVGSSGHEHEPLLMVFDRLGKRNEEVHTRGPAVLVLYDLSAAQDKPGA